MLNFKRMSRIFVLSSLFAVTACHQENPLRHSEVGDLIKEDYVSRQVHALEKRPCTDIFCQAMEKSDLAKEVAIKTNNNLQCPYYFAYPRQHLDLKTVCNAWMQKDVLNFYKAWWERAAKVHDTKPAHLTEDNVTDPAFWQDITQAMDTVKKAHGVTS